MNQIAERIVKKLGITAVHLGFDIIRNQQRAGGEIAYNNMMAKLPKPLQWQYRKYSSTWYDNEYLPLIQSITVDSELAPPLPKHRGWWLFRYYKEEDTPQWMKKTNKITETAAATTTTTTTTATTAMVTTSVAD